MMVLELHLKAAAGVHKVKKVKRCKEDGEEGSVGSSKIMDRVSREPPSACLSSSAQSLECRGHELPGIAEVSLEH